MINRWDEKFDKILLESDIYRERHMGHVKVHEILENLGDMFENITDNIIFVGYTDSVDRILYLTNIENRVVAIADPTLVENKVESRVKRIRGIKTISVEEAARQSNVVYIFTDNYCNKSTYNKLLSSATQTFCLYDIVLRAGADALREYNYLLFPYTTTHEKIMFCRRKYETSIESGIRKKELEELIYLFLEVKDFKFAFRYIEEYINNRYDKDNNMLKFENELKSMLDDLRASLSNRSNKGDFIFIWNDGLRYDELKDLDYLGNKIKNNALFFGNAFTTVFDTRGAMASIFNKRMQIDDFLISKDDCDVENSLLMKMMKSNGYHLITYSDPDLSDKTNTTTRELLDPGTNKLWDGITQIEQCDEAAFLFVHELAETHEPYHSPLLDMDYYFIRGCRDEDYQEHIKISRKYWDQQLGFYMRFLEYDNMKVFMSDHGKQLSLSELITPGRKYLDEFTHVVLMITSNHITSRYEDRLFSLFNMIDLFEALLTGDNNKYESIFGDYIRLQSIDRYNIGDINRKLADGTKKRDMMAFRAVRTKEDMYVLIANGEDEYYILPDFDHNYVKDAKYTERVNHLREINGNNFLDIDNIDFFKGARILYDK